MSGDNVRGFPRGWEKEWREIARSYRPGVRAIAVEAGLPDPDALTEEVLDSMRGTFEKLIAIAPVRPEIPAFDVDGLTQEQRRQLEEVLGAIVGACEEQTWRVFNALISELMTNAGSLAICRYKLRPMESSPPGA